MERCGWEKWLTEDNVGQMQWAPEHLALRSPRSLFADGAAYRGQWRPFP